jgi:hypothetical protein
MTAKQAAAVVDGALAGQIGVPDGVRAYLRNLEQAARALRDEIEAVLLTGGSGDPWLRAAAEELDKLLDHPRGALARALSRRTRDLYPGASGRASLDAAWGAVNRNVSNALLRYHQSQVLLKRLAHLDARFGERLPWHLARALERLKVVPADAERADAVSLEARVRRLEKVEGELEARSKELPVSLEPPLEVVEWPAGVSPEELAAAVTEAENAAAADFARWRPWSRELASAHATRLLGSGKAVSSADPAEAAAREVIGLVAAGVHPGAEDVDAWGIATRAAARERSVGPRAVDSDRPEPPLMGSLLFVEPLFDRFVLVRTGRPWPVRVDARAVRLGSRAPVVAALPPGSAGTQVPLERWATPLFDLPDDPRAEWLATSRAAEILPFARIGSDRWLATVEARGALSSTGTAAWEEEPRRRNAAVRVLPRADLTPGEGILPVGPAKELESDVFGWRTASVRIPLLDLPEAWLRSASNPAGRDHLLAEQQFFQTAGLRVPNRSPRCLGAVRDENGGYLYARPLAFRIDESPALAAWERSDPLAFVSATARLWLALRDAGLALGFYHPRTLGFRVLFGGHDAGEPALEAVALAAPLGTRLGASYRRSKESLGLFPPYERLGVRLPPAQLEGEVALPETEAAALALYGLDRLLKVPIEIPPTTSWNGLSEELSKHHGDWADLIAVTSLLPLISQPSEMAAKIEMVGARKTET